MHLPEESYARSFFESLGLIVHVIAEGPLRTADFSVDGDGRGYTVEVKARDDSEEWNRNLERGAVAYQERSLGHGRWAEDVARAALKQMESSDPHHSRWWVLWLAITCRSSPDSMLAEAIGSLFGVRQVAYCLPGSDDALMRDCLFAKPGVFENHVEIVASVVATGRDLAFCVNEFAPDHLSFETSLLFGRMSVVNSAASLTRNRRFFQVADLSIDRRDDKTLSAYLEKSYGIQHAIVLDMTDHSASMRVSRREAKRL